VATQVSLAQVNLSWLAPADNIAVTGYDMYRNGLGIGTVEGTSYTDAGVVAGSLYSYTVAAYDASQNISNRSTSTAITISVDTDIPSVPANVSAQQVSATGAKLSWATSTDNVGVAGYQVYRNGIKIASAGGPSYADTKLVKGMNYVYKIAAYDAAGNISTQSQSVPVVIQQTNGPAASTISSNTLVGTSSVQLSWSISNDALAIDHYTVYRNGTSMATVSSTNYLDAGVSAGTYYYNVTASDISGAVSGMSPSSTIIIPTVATTGTATAPTTATSSTVTSAAGASSTTAVTTFTQSLYYGLRSTQVSALQSLLAAKGYMSSAYVTGFFGNITKNAVGSFQCASGIACSGDAGWGLVGPKTRAALNAAAAN